MNLRFLRTFVAIADNAGFARAAARLNLTQSAASRQIQALEDELGLRLFARIGRSARLTSEGEDLLVRSRRLLFDAEALGQRASALKTRRSRTCCGLAPPRRSSRICSRIFCRATANATPASRSIWWRMAAPACRVALSAATSTSPSCRPAMIASPVGRSHPMHVLAVLPQGHRLSRRAVLDVTELADEPLLRLGSSFASHGWFEAACQVAHIRPRVLLESVAPQTLIALARTGHGVAVVPSPVRIPRAGVRAAVVVHRGVSIGRWAVAAWDSQRFLPPYAVQFVEELVAHCRRGYPGHEYGRRAPALPRPREAIS